MHTGSQELIRLAAAWLATAAFAVTFLAGQAQGVSASTALVRGAIVAGVAFLLGRLLMAPAVHAILAAMARDRAEALARIQQAEESGEVGDT